MTAEDLLHEITDYCRSAGMAESTFGRVAINDGKLVARLRNGGRITTDTLARIRGFMASRSANDSQPRPAIIERAPVRSIAPSASARPAADDVSDHRDPRRTFRFFDNRQKYLLFVTTCSEKWDVASRVAQELASIHPRPPAVRLFDAGVGDGAVLTWVLRAAHDRFPAMPFFVAGKEISLEDVRLLLQKMADRFYEHPATVLTLTNLAYAEAPRFQVRSPAAAARLVWHEVALTGSTAHQFEQQITALEPFLVENWKAAVSPKTGNPIYERPVVLTLYREDHRFLLDPLIPRLGAVRADYDLIIASQPYRARAPLEFKAKRVIAPLVRALGPGGRLIGIHSYGNDPGMEIIRKIWPDDNPFTADRHAILKAVKTELGSVARDYNFNAYSDARSLFRYVMRALPTELEGSIGTSTAFAAWNAAIYVAQVEDERLAPVVYNERCLEATKEVLRERGGLWFYDESYVVSRRRGDV